VALEKTDEALLAILARAELDAPEPVGTGTGRMPPAPLPLDADDAKELETLERADVALDNAEEALLRAPDPVGTGTGTMPPAPFASEALLMAEDAPETTEVPITAPDETALERPESALDSTEEALEMVELIPLAPLMPEMVPMGTGKGTAPAVPDANEDTPLFRPDAALPTALDALEAAEARAEEAALGMAATEETPEIREEAPEPVGIGTGRTPAPLPLLAAPDMLGMPELAAEASEDDREGSAEEMPELAAPAPWPSCELI
jgi:hypothetical protein